MNFRFFSPVALATALQPAAACPGCRAARSESSSSVFNRESRRACDSSLRGLLALSVLAVGFMGPRAFAGGPEGAITADKLDLIFVVDASPSMSDENEALTDGLYSGLVAPLENRGKDVRVIVVAQFGTTGAELCFENPLGAIPFGGCDFSPPEPVNTPGFKHYSNAVWSFDAWCDLLGTYDGTLPDGFSQAPEGWSIWLREEAFKHIFILSDADTACSYDGETYNTNDGLWPSYPEVLAATFDDALRGLSETQFGTAADRRYMVHSIVGVPDNPLRPVAIWFAPEPIPFGKCTFRPSEEPGHGHQALSRLTGGIRYSVCRYTTDDLSFYNVVNFHPALFIDRLEMPSVK